jgi:predicted DNA-binding transcriptional regulator YafY
VVYRPTARVLAALELLQAHERMIGPQLARRLEVNVRTVRDYMTILADLGIPVEAVRGRYGGYRLRPGYKLPPLIFTQDESLALTLSLLLAQEHGLARADSAFEGILAKIMRLLPEATRTQVQAVEQSVILEHRSFRTLPSLPVVARLCCAQQRGHSVHLRYRSASGEVSERVFDPYGVVSHEGTWYTIGYCHLRQGQRLFRLDRIEQIERTDLSFSCPTGFQALEAVQQVLASIARRWQIEVWLPITLEEAQRRSHLSRVYFTQVHHGVLLRADAEELTGMARFLAGLDIPFIIHHPPELRDALRDYALKLLRYAEQIEV